MPPELLAPAGSFDAALAAFQYGADAAYLGLPRFSARADADNLSVANLRTLLVYARSFCPAKKIYVTFNTLVLDKELAQAIEILDALDDLAPDGVIVQDLGIARIVRSHFPRLPLHASTQMAVHNLYGARALAKAGFRRVVLARELTLQEMEEITRSCGIETEVFIHGALCYSVSGLCLFSSITSGRSGNRGRCAYCCREAFTLSDTSSCGSPNANYPFSMRDLCLAPILDRVNATGVSSLKIEGRMKSPLYVACVTDYYRRKLDGKLTPEEERALIQDLQTVFSRPWTRLYSDNIDTAPDKIIDTRFIGHRGALIGSVQKLIRERDGTRWLRLTTNRALEKHDGIQVEQPEGGKPFGFAAIRMRPAGNRHTVLSQPSDTTVEIALPEGDIPPLPQGSPVFCAASQAVRRRYAISSVREADLNIGRPADIEVALSETGIKARATADSGAIAVETALEISLTPARQPEHTREAVGKCFARTGKTDWQLGKLTVDDPAGCYAPPSKLNDVRRALLEKLTRAWEAAHLAKCATLLGASGFNAPRPAEAGTVPLNRPLPSRITWTVKLRMGSPLPSDQCLTGIDNIVLDIGHHQAATIEGTANALRGADDRRNVTLALPLLTRGHELRALTATVRKLIDDGWDAWECADLAGVQILAEFGMRPVSADWSLYALNNFAARELAEMGCGRFVLSPEIGYSDAVSLMDAIGNGKHGQDTEALLPELTVYRHTPLFISETAPCCGDGISNKASGISKKIGCLTFTDRRGRCMICHKVDNRWITVLSSAFCIARRFGSMHLDNFRIDLSWSPTGTDPEHIIPAVLAGRRLPDTQTEGFERTLA